MTTNANAPRYSPIARQLRILPQGWIQVWLAAAALAFGLGFGVGIAHADPSESIEMLGRDASGAARPFSLVHTDVSAELTSGYGSVVMTQTFINPYDVPLEALYRFPLPHDAAVDRVAVLIGSTLLESEIRERDQAQREYEQARDEGRQASLTEEVRPNLFQHAVANVLPGQAVHITLHLVAPLERDQGEYVFGLPMVAGPRYMPADRAQSVDSHAPTPAVGMAHAADINPAYAADELLEHGLTVELHVTPGMQLFGVHSPTHELEVENTSATEAWARLADPDAVPNRSFEVRYRLAGEQTQVGLVAHRRAEVDPHGTFSLTVEPALHVEDDEVQPKEMIFVVDTSGSMMGAPIDKAKAAMAYALRHMGPRDTFQIVNFADNTAALAEAPLANTPANLARGLAFLEGLTSSGGTEMLAGVRAALDPPADPHRLRIVAFVTDGYIGNEDDVLSEVKARIGGARLFSFGVGEDVHQYLLDRLAREGRGAVQLVRLADPIEDVVERFYFRIARPVLTDVTVDWGGLQVVDVNPQPIPDLFADQPLRLVGRYQRGGKATVVVRGSTTAGPAQFAVDVELPERSDQHEVLATMWARQRVNELIAASGYDPSEEVAQKVLALGLKHRIITPYTSFVAVERELIANPDPAQLRRALAAVHLPAGMRPDGVFGEAKAPATLSPHAIKPGDPEIVVRAAPTAQRVVAILPWGESVECAWDADLDGWLGRFLVPREAAEGSYRVRIFIVDATGQVDTLTTYYRVDTTAPQFELDIDRDELAAGQCAALEVRPRQEDALVHKRGTDVIFRSDIKRLRAYLTDPTNGLVTERLQPEPGGAVWTGELCVPADAPVGMYVLRVVATDMAGNHFEEEVSLWVR